MPLKQLKLGLVYKLTLDGSSSDSRFLNTMDPNLLYDYGVFRFLPEKYPLREITLAHVIADGRRGFFSTFKKQTFAVRVWDDYKNEVYEIHNLNGLKIVKINTNYHETTCFISASGKVYLLESNRDTLYPTTIQLPTVGVVKDASVWTKGNNLFLYENNDLYVGSRKILSNVHSVKLRARLCMILTKDRTLLSKVASPDGSISNEPPLPVAPFTSARIKDFAVGFKHILTITEDGILCAYGDNDLCQLGVQTTTSNFEIPRMNALVRFVDCITHPMSCLSAAKTVDGHVYVWGGLRDSVVPEPLRIYVSSLDRVIPLFDAVQATPRNIIIARNNDGYVFDDIGTSDCIIQCENSSFHVHQSVLSIKSMFFRTLLRSRAPEHRATIKLEGYSARTYREYIKYLYYDRLILNDEPNGVNDPSADSFGDIIWFELIKIAHEYMNVELLSDVIRRVMTFLNASNLVRYYQLAVLLEIDELLNCIRCVYLTDTAGVHRSYAYKLLAPTDAKSMSDKLCADVS